MRKIPHAVGGALGSLARISQALAVAEDAIIHPFRESYGHYNDGSYGKGLILSLLNQLPELVIFKDHMESAVRQDLPKAFTSYEANLSALQLACACRMCREDFGLQEDYCCIMIIEIVVVITRTMSNTAVPIDIAPSRLGVEAIYARQVVLWEKMENEAHTDGRIKEFGPAIRAAKAFPQPIFDALRIFCERVPTNVDIIETTSAVSASGICVYYEALSQLSDDSESVARVSVVPGRIEMHKKVYYHMTDLTTPNFSTVSGWPECLSLDELSVILKEKHSSLQIAFEVHRSDSDAGQSILMLPAKTVECFWSRRGLITCTAVGCKAVAKDAKIKERRPGYIMCELAGVEIEVFEVNLLQRWMLMNINININININNNDRIF